MSREVLLPTLGLNQVLIFLTQLDTSTKLEAILSIASLMTHPSIQLTVDGTTSELTGERLLSQAVAVPADIARFDGQLVVHLEDVLGPMTSDQQVGCRSSRGERVSFAACEVPSYSLLSTNTPSWKLVPAGRDRLHEITLPRFLLRKVTEIEVGSQLDQEDLSDQVFTNLTDAMLNAPTVRFLNLTNAGLESFPGGIFDLVRLESLNLGKNSIETLPPGIGELGNLKMLKLSRNKIKTLPEEIGRLKNLTELHLSNNEIEELPEKLWNLVDLQLLNLSSNRLASISDEIARLTQLKDLELDHNRIPSTVHSHIEQLIPQTTIEW